MSVDATKDELYFYKSRGIPVFVMLPLDTVNADGVFRYASAAWFSQALHLLAASGVHGVAVDAWWGAIEKEPREYNWSGYKQLMETIKATGLKVQVVLSCHACGGNVGDSVQIPLPAWVLQCGEKDPDLFFTDRPRDGSLGHRNREYISIWADDAPTLWGRTPIQCYEDFIISFRDNLSQELGVLIEEVVVGAGPCGELRYPSYAEANGWRFPGVGEFQCYDRRALASLAQAAREAGYPEWGNGGPHDSGDYSTCPEESGFFSFEGSWDTSYGRFFLEWYSGSLLKHGSRLLQAAKNALAGRVSLQKPSNTSSEASADTYMAPTCHTTSVSIQPASGAPCPNPSSVRDHPSNGMELDDSLLTADEIHLARIAGVALNKKSPSGQAGEGTPLQAHATLGGLSEHSAEIYDDPEASVRFLSLDGGRLSLGTSGGAAVSQAGEDGGSDGSSHALESINSAAETDSQQRSSMDTQQAVSCSGSMAITLKIAGIHWWFRSRSHAAELTAGYYNTANRDGYAAIVDLCAKYGANLALTCVEMCDTQHPSAALCGPEGLLKQIRSLCASRNVPLSGENALPIFQIDSLDSVALERIVFNTRAWHGAAAMSAYFSNGGGSQGALWSTPSPRQSPSSQKPAQEHTPSGSASSGSFTAPRQNTGVPPRHTYSLGNMPTVNVGIRDCTKTSYSCEASPSGLGVAGGIGCKTPPQVSSLPPAHSDPAIAATGLRADSYANISEPLPPMRSFTLLRLCPDLLQPSFQGPWLRFITRMRQGGFH